MHSFHRLAPLLGAFLILFPRVHAQNTWYVDVAGVPPGSGTQQDPYTDLQFALAQPGTQSGDTLLVLPGEYVGNVDCLGKGVTVRSTDGPLATVLTADASGAAVTLSGPTQPTTSLIGFTVRSQPGVFTAGVFGGNATVQRCILVGHAGSVGVFGSGSGAFSTHAPGLSLDQCTVVGNQVGVGVAPQLGSISVSNSCMTGNGFDVDFLAPFQNSTFAYSLWQGGSHAGTGNLDLPGGLWDAPGDVHLAPGSPCIDAGDPNAPPDPDGTRADIGALPFDAGYVPAPGTYCTAKVDSGGCLSAIGVAGDASLATSAPLTVSATNLLAGVNGLLFYGFGPQAAPFLGGTLCVSSPLTRTALQFSGLAGGTCQGSFAFDFKAWALSGSDPGLQPGTLVYGQYWYRDPADPSGFGSSLSDAAQFGLGL